jgi:hypothetical protein
MEDAALTPDDKAAQLVGLADPNGLSMGFLIPIFRQPPRNSLLVQTVSGAGTITGFEPCELPDVETIDVPPREIAPHGPEVWAFQLEDTLIVGNDESARQALAGLLESRLAGLPLLAMEVAEFLSLSDHRDKFARIAFDRMAQASPRAAKAWRDLSVLTPDVRRLLLRELGQDAKWPRRILATLETGAVVAIHGLNDWPNAEISKVLGLAVAGATEIMPLLYDGGNRKLLAYPTPRREPDDRVEVRLVVDRAIDVEQLSWRLRRIGATTIEFLGLDSEKAFEEQSYPTIVLVDGLAPERLREVKQTSRQRQVPVLVYGASAVGSPRDSPSFEEYSGLILQVAGRRSSKTQELTDIVGIQTGVSVILEVIKGRIPPPTQYSVLVTTQTRQTHRSSNGLVALYDEAYGIGLAPWNAIHLRPTETLNLHPQEQTVADILFPDLVSLRSGGWSPPGEEWGATYALLVSPGTRTADDELRHRNNVVRLLETVGWRVSDISPSLDTFELQGSRSNLSVTVGPPLPLDELSAIGPSRHFKFGRISRIRIAPRVSTSVVVRHLAYAKELVVRLKDVLLDGYGPTIWGIVAAQLIRMPRTAPDFWRTHYVRALIREAVILRRYHAEFDQRIIEAIATDDTAKSYQFMIEGKNMRGHALRARVVFLRRGDRDAWQPEGRFVLQVSSDGPSIEPFVPDQEPGAKITQPH